MPALPCILTITSASEFAQSTQRDGHRALANGKKSRPHSDLLASPHVFRAEGTGAKKKGVGRCKRVRKWPQSTLALERASCSHLPCAHVHAGQRKHLLASFLSRLDPNLGVSDYICVPLYSTQAARLRHALSWQTTPTAAPSPAPAPYQMSSVVPGAVMAGCADLNKPCNHSSDCCSWNCFSPPPGPGLYPSYCVPS